MAERKHEFVTHNRQLAVKITAVIIGSSLKCDNVYVDVHLIKGTNCTLFFKASCKIQYTENKLCFHCTSQN